MNSVKIYKWSAVTALSVGLGMVLGYYMGSNGSTTPAWIGVVLIILGAVTAGMSISTRSQKNAITKQKSHTQSPEPAENEIQSRHLS